MIRRTLTLLSVSLVPAATAHAVPLKSGRATIGDRTLKIASGRLENGEGVVRLSGTLKVAGKSLGRPQIDLRRGGLVTARVDGLRQPVLSVRTANARVGTNPTKIRIRGVELRPTGALRGGRTLALAVKAIPRHVRLAGGQSTLALDEGFRSDLAAEMVTPTANEGAVIDDAGRAQFPIAGGRLLLGRKGGGAIDHGGGLSFSKGNVVELRLTDFKISPGPSGVLRARVDESDGPRVAIATVGFGSPAYSANAALIAEAPALLTGEGAAVLNAELGTERFAAGATLGLLAVDAAVQ